MEMQFTPLDAYFHILQVLEQVNAVLGSIFASDVLAKEDITNKVSGVKNVNTFFFLNKLLMLEYTFIGQL